jgi:hypothetical protein
MRLTSTVSFTAPWQSWSGVRCGGEVRMGLQKCEFI